MAKISKLIMFASLVTLVPFFLTLSEESADSMKMKSAEAEIVSVVNSHIDKISDLFKGKEELRVTLPRWKRLLNEPVKTWIGHKGLLLADEALSKNKCADGSRDFGSIYVTISVVPAIEAARIRQYLNSGYNQKMLSIFNESGFKDRDIDLAHLIIGYEGTDKIICHMLFFPALSISGHGAKGTPPIMLWPQDIMTASEKAEAGL